MAKPWDESMKTLVRANPQAFVRWLIPNAKFLKEHREKLKDWDQEVDLLLEILVDGEIMLLHVEFQTYNDTTMAERLLRYNVAARHEHTLPVLSFVIYLLKDGTIVPSPLRWVVPTGQEVLQFHFHTIEIGELSPEDIRSTGEVNLLPLLPLTKDGATRSIVSSMLRELDVPEHKELALLGFKLASLVFKRKSQDNLAWLIRSFKEMHDILHDTPIYQLILEEGREKGLEEGREKGLEQAREEERLNLRLILVNIAQARFPTLVDVVKARTARIEDINALRQLVINFGTTQDGEKIQQYLTTDDKLIN
jgi:predicted transposase/invertase (TIGR01784 family)